MSYKTYYMCELPDSVEKLLRSADSVQYGDQVGIFDIDVAVESTRQQVRTGCLILFVYKIVVLYLRMYTPFVGMIDSLVCEGGTAREFVKAFKALLKWAETNTYYHKLQTRTHHEHLLKAIKMIPGSILEGTHPESFRMPDGKFVSEYTIGYILPKSLPYKGNKKCQ